MNKLTLQEQINNLETILKTQELSTQIKQDLKKELERLKKSRKKKMLITTARQIKTLSKN